MGGALLRTVRHIFPHLFAQDKMDASFPGTRVSTRTASRSTKTQRYIMITILAQGTRNTATSSRIRTAHQAAQECWRVCVCLRAAQGATVSNGGVALCCSSVSTSTCLQSGDQDSCCSHVQSRGERHKFRRRGTQVSREGDTSFLWG